MSNKKNKSPAKTALIYIRYILPVALCIAIVCTMFIPCLQYSTTEGTQDEMSAAQLISNSWDQVREYLFGTSEKEITQEKFSWTVLILLPVLLLLFAVGFISSVVVAVGALRYINDRDFRKTDARIWFITLLPNRIVVCVLQALILPVLFYSRIIIPLYTEIMHVAVLLNTTFFEPWVWGLAAYAVIVALSIASAHFEKELDADPFKKVKPPVVRVIDREDEEESEEKESEFKTEAERRYYENQKRAREEQAELIKKLLNKNDEEDK
ncbi:MAG: hypothetical protein IJ011_06895 [Clostridia bacterium]|nr:hypothetical protein [Clostridia bacterium]